MYFCLAPSPHNTPHPQTWRYITPSASKSCSTQLVTLFASATETWKLHASDQLSTSTVARLDDRGESVIDVITVEQRIRALELGDNVAEEGVLRDAV